MLPLFWPLLAAALLFLYIATALDKSSTGSVKFQSDKQNHDSHPQRNK